jgi:hypothetical protein
MKTQQAPKHAPGAPRTPFLLLVLGLVIGGMCALLALNTASAANELQRHDYASSDESVANEVAALENAVAASAAPGNIAAAAARLGMVPAGNPAFFVVRPDGSIKLMGSPAAASGYPTYVPPASTPKTTPKSTPKTTPKSTPKSTAKSSGKSTAKSDGRSRATSTSKSPPKSSTHPTSTPTPNSTLPGGVR